MSEFAELDGEAAARAQVFAEAFGLDERDSGRLGAALHLAEGVVGGAGAGGVVGDDERGVGGVPSERVEERIDERRSRSDLAAAATPCLLR